MSLLPKIANKLFAPVHIAPLVSLRILFGLVMFVSILRFIVKGWIYDIYVTPKYFFTYYGFEWVKPLGETGMYLLFLSIAVSTLFIMAGCFYKYAATYFFLAFTYVELIDKTNYLNHYYFISIISLLLIFSPAHRYFSIDVIRKPALRVTHIPFWIIGAFRLQMAYVYFFAGLAKLNYDWLFRAMPLKIWLPAKAYLPVMGPLFDKVWVAYFFSWAGAIYDLFIPFLLIAKKYRLVSYSILLVFHIMTSILFNIGMFPYIMMGITLIFFPESLHIKFIEKLEGLLRFLVPARIYDLQFQTVSFRTYGAGKLLMGAFILHFILQALLPFRYLLYPGELFWTEQGYRFSWRVMLMEKGGTAFFYVHDPKTGKRAEITNSDYLTPNQEKMMSTQPDMILQFARFIEEEYRGKGINDPAVTVESYVTLNGRGSRLFIDKEVDLTKEKESFLAKNWILPYTD